MAIFNSLSTRMWIEKSTIEIHQATKRGSVLARFFGFDLSIQQSNTMGIQAMNWFVSNMSYIQ